MNPVTVPSSTCAQAQRARLTAVVPLIASALCGLAGKAWADESQAAGFAPPLTASSGYRAPAGPAPDLNPRRITFSGTQSTIPFVVSAVSSRHGRLGTLIEGVNVSDTAASLSWAIRDGNGNPLEMPLADEPCGPNCLNITRSSGSATLERGAAFRMVISDASPTLLGWAEFSVQPDAAVAVSGRIWFVGDAIPGTGARRISAYAMVPPAGAFREAFMLVTGRPSTDLVLVNLHEKGRQEITAHFRSGNVSCEARVSLPPFGQAVVDVSGLLPCVAAGIGLLTIRGEHDFTGFGLNYVRTRGLSGNIDGAWTSAFIQPVDPEYSTLEHWTVSRGQLMFGGLRTSGCLTISDLLYQGATYTVHASRWQRRTGRFSPWEDLPDSEREGQVCAHSPTGTGEYRGVAEITIGGKTGQYASGNLLTIERPALSFGPASVSDQALTVGTAMPGLTLPMSTGGEWPVTYRLEPAVPGLAFDASTRRLSGTPTTAGVYVMTLVARDAAGETATLGFTIVVHQPVSGRPEDDHSSDLGRATPLLLGGRVSGSIETGGDIDVFRLDLPRRTQVTMYTTGGLDTTGALFDANGGELARDDDSGTGGNFLIAATLDSGTYFLGVGSYGTGTGDYAVHAVPGLGDDHSSDPEHATPLPLGGRVAGSIETGEDVDTFRLVLTRRTPVTLYTTGSLDTVGALVDANGAELAVDDDSGSGGNFQIVITLDSGTYFLGVGSYGTETGDYVVHAVPGRRDDHSSDARNATPLPLGGRVAGSIETGEDIDVFRLVLASRTRVTLYTTGSLDTVGALVDADGAELAVDDDSGSGTNFRIDITLDRGTYFLGVGSYGTETGDYAVHAAQR